MPREKAILIRLSDKEHDELKRAAKIDGAPVATFARRSIMRRARRVLDPKPPTVKP